MRDEVVHTTPPCMIWEPRFAPGQKPGYLTIVSSLATDIQTGRLREGDRLPAQRTLARTIGVNLTTVMRAVAEARRRGLIVARRGRGTYVQSGGRRAVVAASDTPDVIDLTSNFPPERWESTQTDADPKLVERLAATAGALTRGEAAAALLRYSDRGGSPADRYAGQVWLAQRGVTIDAERVLVTSGADHALFLALACLTNAGDMILAEDLTYPGLRAIAAMLGRRVVPLRTDGHGIVPDDVRTACRAKPPAMLFCSPTIQNPTATVLSLERRKAIVALAREHGFVILEDDVYGPLASDSPPALAHLARERVVYVTSLSKVVVPGLRVGYLATADDALGEKLAAAARSTTGTPPSLTTAVVSRWILDGTADLALKAIKRENEARHAFAIRALNGHRILSHPAAPHFWLALPRGWTRAAFVERARRNGVAVLGSDAFATTDMAPEGVRVCLGAARNSAEARRAVTLLARTLRETHGVGPAVV